MVAGGSLDSWWGIDCGESHAIVTRDLMEFATQQQFVLVSLDYRLRPR